MEHAAVAVDVVMVPVEARGDDDEVRREAAQLREHLLRHLLAPQRRALRLTRRRLHRNLRTCTSRACQPPRTRCATLWAVCQPACEAAGGLQLCLCLCVGVSDGHRRVVAVSDHFTPLQCEGAHGRPYSKRRHAGQAWSQSLLTLTIHGKLGSASVPEAPPTNSGSDEGS
eukprot:267939-Rhodomonas_salina.1